MRVICIVVALVGLAGCAADARIARLRSNLFEEVRAQRIEQALAVEKRIDDVMFRRYGRLDPSAIQVRTAVAEDYAHWGHPGRATEIGFATLAELESAYGDNDQRILPGLLSLARIHLASRKWKEAEEVTDKAATICGKVYNDTDSYQFDECHLPGRYDIPPLYKRAGAYRKAAREYLRSDSIDADPANRRSGIAQLTMLGRYYSEAGAYAEAIAYFQRCVDESLSRYERVPSPRKLWGSATGDVEVLALDSAHSFETQSPRCLEDLIEMRRRIGHDDVAARLSVLQNRLWSEGPDLEKELTERVRFSDKAWGDDINTSSDANTLAWYYAGKRRNEDAARMFEEAIRLMDRGIEKAQPLVGVFTSPLLIDELLGLGRSYEHLGRHAEAAAAYGRAAILADADLHPLHQWRLDSIAGSARSLFAAGRPAESAAEWKAYLALAERIRGRDHADYATGLAGVAETLRVQGRASEAASVTASAESIRREYARRVESVRDVPMPVSLRSSTSPAN